MRVDFPRLLGDIAYLLGDLDPINPAQRIACSQEKLAERLVVARGTLRGWLEGSRPKHDEGERLIEVWCTLSSKSRTFVPLERRSFSASQVR